MKSEIQNILMGILALVSVRQTVVASAFDHWQTFETQKAVTNEF